MFKLKPNFWGSKNITFFSLMLYPLSLITMFLFKIKSLNKGKKFKIPIICIGNIYIGGTGKTPLAIKVHEIVSVLKKDSAFIKKYYDYLEDEISLLKQKGKVYAFKSRIKSIKKLVEDKYELAILDDGFQDFSIKKDISILCFNSKQGVGNGMVIPAGPLREPIQGIKRADCVMINGNKLEIFENNLLKHNPSLEIFYFKYELLNFQKYKNKKLIPFAGIGNPNNFFDILHENNLICTKTFCFPDHHKFTDKELEKLINEAKKNNAILITTEKDYLRINKRFQSSINYLKINLKIQNENKFLNFIKKKL